MGWVRAFIIAACLLVGAGAAGVSWVQSVLRPVDTGPVVVTNSILSGVGSADAKQLRDFYAAMADIVVRDGQAKAPVCKTTFDLRNRHSSALQMAFVHTGMVGKYPGLGDRLDAYLLEAVGSTDVPLTPAIRETASKAFAAIR